MGFASFVFVTFLVYCNGIRMIDLVDPLIGSGGKGFGCAAVSPGAQRPYSFVRFSPDTSHSDFPWLPFEHFGGYQYNDNQITAFSQLHQQGAGEAGLGVLAMMPTSVIPTESMISSRGWTSFFSHQHEVARVNLYRVSLLPSMINVSLTSSLHSSCAFICWPPNVPRVVVIPASHSAGQKGQLRNSTVLLNVTQATATIGVFQAGNLMGSGVAPWAHVVFRGGVSVVGWGVWSGDNHLTHNSTMSASGGVEENVGAYVVLSNNDDNGCVEVGVGVSWIGKEQAKINWELEGKSFNEMMREGQEEWEKVLQSAVPTWQDSDQHEDAVKFATALYHTHCAPSSFSEPTTTSNTSVYLGFDGAIHPVVAPMQTYYTDLSMWDTHRCQNQWLALTSSSVASDIAQSLVLMAQQLRPGGIGGYPSWAFANSHTCSMDGQPALNIITDAYLWGAQRFNVEEAFRLMKITANANSSVGVCSRDHMDAYNTLGYIPVELDVQGSCVTLAYSHNDFAVASMAKALNQTSDYQFYLKRSDSYLQVFSPKDLFVCPRLNNSGAFQCPAIRTNVFSKNYIEGDAWHYRFYGTDPLKTFGSPQHLVDALEELMMLGRLDPFNILPNPYYWAGNEPDILAPWEFAHANRSDLIAKHVHWVARHRYSTAADGVPGNDDYGALSSWLVWAYAGMYPLYSGTTKLALGIPMFPLLTITREDGSVISIQRKGAGEDLKQVIVNGKVHIGSVLDLNDLLQGPGKNSTILFITA